MSTSEQKILEGVELLGFREATVRVEAAKGPNIRIATAKVGKPPVDKPLTGSQLK